MLRLFTNLWEKFKEYIILILLILISLILLTQNQSAGVKKVRTIAFGTFASVTSVFNDIFNTSSIRRENENLRRTNAELMLQISKLREYGIIGEDLKEMLALKDTSNLPLIPASIVSKSLSVAQGTVTVNTGSVDGVKPGMPVINHSGLVGIILSTSENYSIARTLQNVNLKVTVKCERTGEHAVMRWNGESLVLINIPKTYQIQKGDRIVTSEISSIIPVSVPVGIAADIGKVETGIFNEITVIPFVDFFRAEHVFILGIVKSKQIEDLELNFFNK
ncbi:MAG TPA: rod shape-determining protein MreC [Ignavibacteriaceae bacterium]|nr:rod shape-determining protein MreC [Ignavibacteriaceae bacterium]